jgi:hypothetical protein
MVGKSHPPTKELRMPALKTIDQKGRLTLGREKGMVDRGLRQAREGERSLGAELRVALMAYVRDQEPDT